jgi:chromosome segregation ATPase
MAVDVQDKLERELFDVKEHASGLAQNVEALKKELGAARKQADRVPGLEEDVADLKSALASANAENKKLVAELEKAADKVANAEAVVAAAKSISDGLGFLSAQ